MVKDSETLTKETPRSVRAHRRLQKRDGFPSVDLSKLTSVIKFAEDPTNVTIVTPSPSSSTITMPNPDPDDTPLTPLHTTPTDISQLILQRLADQQRQLTEQQHLNNDTVNQLCKGLQALRTLTTTLTCFDGLTDDVDLFLEDFDRFTGNATSMSEDDKLSTLVSHLTGNAKLWYRVQTPEIKNNYQNLRTALQDNYKKTDFQKLTRKSEIYQLRQNPDEPFRDFVLRVQQKAAGISIQNADIVSICIHGALPALQPFLVIGAPATLEALISLPIVAEKSFESKVLGSTPIMAVINDKLDSIQKKIKADKREVTFAPTQPSPDVSRRNSPSPYRRAASPERPQQDYRWQPPQSSPSSYRRAESPQRSLQDYHRQPNQDADRGRNNYTPYSPRSQTMQPDYFWSNRPFQQRPYQFRAQSLPRQFGRRPQQPPNQTGTSLGLPWYSSFQNYSCNNCGSLHYDNDCPARNRACRFCQITGHFSSMCRKKMNRQSSE